MGVGTGTLEFLLDAADGGVSFQRTATIGRQALFVRPTAVRRALARHGRGADVAFGEQSDWLEPVLDALGAREITSIDASEYEGATVIHDLNRPLPVSLERRFSAVFDGGSLEHIFDVSVALENYMGMVEVGGHLLITTMANNGFGHGFYQFSPELFFRVFTPANGFELERVLVVEDDIVWRWALGRLVPVERVGRFYEVADPSAIHSRVTLRNRRPVLMHVRARRMADVPVFAEPPQQSDYTELWSDTSTPAKPGPGLTARLRRGVARRLPTQLRSAVQSTVVPRAMTILKPVVIWQESREQSFRNRRFFTPVSRLGGDRSGRRGVDR